jgi:3-phosphoglycerate kinase
LNADLSKLLAKEFSKSFAAAKMSTCRLQSLPSGALAYPFLAAQRISVGNSKLDPQDVPLAQSILDDAATSGKHLHLPVDHWTVLDVTRGGPTTCR